MKSKTRDYLSTLRIRLYRQRMAWSWLMRGNWEKWKYWTAKVREAEQGGENG